MPELQQPAPENVTAAIQTRGLTKFYGKVRGVENVDLEVRVGEVFGFLGPNGAGKSTTIRVLLDFLRPTRGRAAVLSMDCRRRSVEIRRRVGYLPGELAMYDTMTGRETLRYFAALRGLDDLGTADALAERFGLDVDRRFRAYSSGNRQKLGLVQAFMHEPELLILDEPTSALDPLVQQEFHHLVDEVREAGRTVFLSSHILPEVERMADRVAIIRNGRIVAVEDVHALKQKAARRLEMRFADRVPLEEFSRLPRVRDARSDDDGHLIEIVVEGSVDSVIKAAAKHEMLNLITHEGDLEEAFLAYYQEEAEGDGAQ